MDTTRRMILRGMAATPFVAAAGGLILPSTAQADEAAAAAAPESLDLVLRTHAKGSGTSYPDVIKGLLKIADNEKPADNHGLDRATLDRVLDDTDKQGKAVKPDWPGASLARLGAAFQWEGAGARNSIKNDFKTKYWRPQGISSHYDSTGSGSKEVLLVSWYARAGKEKQGARVSFVDMSDPAAPKYRHVLLVEPLRSGRRLDFKPATLHAGGIAWYGNRLYIADTIKGLRVFNTDEMLEVATGGPADECGYKNGKYYALGYKYVLPQSRAYDHVAPNDVELQQRYSQVAVDRTTSPHSLVVSEFVRPLTRSSRVVRWNLHPGSGALAPVGADGRITSVARDSIAKGGQVQGAVSVAGTFYLSASQGRGYGTVRTWRKPVTGSGAPAAFAWHQAEGPEDLSYDGRTDVLWCVNEYESNRYVYAMKV